VFAQAFSACNFSHQFIFAKYGRKAFQLVPYFLQYFEVAILNSVGNDWVVSQQRAVERAQKLLSAAGISQIANGFFHGQKAKECHALQLTVKQGSQTTFWLKTLVSEVQPRRAWKGALLNGVFRISGIANDPHAFHIEGLWLNHRRRAQRRIL